MKAEKGPLETRGQRISRRLGNGTLNIISAVLLVTVLAIIALLIFKEQSLEAEEGNAVTITDVVQAGDSMYVYTSDGTYRADASSTKQAGEFLSYEEAGQLPKEARLDSSWKKVGS